MSRSLRSAALLCCGALLFACGPKMVKLDPKKVQRVDLLLLGGVDGGTFCPSQSVPEVVAVVVYEKNKLLETLTPSNQDGRLHSREFEWTSEVGEVADNGVLVLPVDLFPWHDRTFTVKAVVPKRPEMKAELQLTPRYDCGGEAFYGGLHGWNGRAAADGEAGGHGPRIEVAVAYVETKLHGRLVLVRVRDRDLGRLGYYLLDPRVRRPLAITVKGGDGGSGGDGGDGGNGGSGDRGVDGAQGADCQNGQDGGRGTDGEPGTDGQPGGRGGDGGNGGQITLVYPAAFPELANVLAFGIQGGQGGAGGRGGKGGKGGDGGAGGRGGWAGSMSSPVLVCSTPTVAGKDGREGDRGRDGNEGATGAAGRPGDSGWFTSRTGRIQDMFAFELERGWSIVSDEPVRP